METLIQIIFPSIIIPTMLSLIIWYLAQRQTSILIGLALIWLPSYIWISGLPSFPPSEAKDWLWLMLIISIIVLIVFENRHAFLIKIQSILLAVTLITIAWPVLQYQFTVLLLIQLSMVVLIAYSTLYCITNIKISSQLYFYPMLSLTISSAGLALIVTLQGSLLIGQLAGVLSVILTTFTFLTFFNRKTKLAINLNYLTPLLLLYFALLVIAGIYVELSLGLALLLLIAPIVGVIPKLRFSFGFSLLAIVLALSWLLITIDSSSYY